MRFVNQSKNNHLQQIQVQEMLHLHLYRGYIIFLLVHWQQEYEYLKYLLEDLHKQHFEVLEFYLLRRLN